jgi:LysM repeat protein
VAADKTAANRKTAPQADAKVPAPGEYRVRSGDTLARLAQKF